jgi:hypothetical protein
MDSSPVPTSGLVAMWRGVYQKAAAVAEARTRALLGEHVGERHGRRGISFVFDGGGAVLTGGVKAEVELPWAYALEGWALYAPTSGTVLVDLLVSAGLATFPADLESICGDARPELEAAQKARSDDLTGWTTTALPRGSILRVVLAAPSGVQLLTLTLFLRAI